MMNYIVLALLLATVVSPIEVAPGSDCASFCMNDPRDNPNDINSSITLAD